MGRRKDRRLAAISAAGRRVKLDLSAEPTGDAAHSSLHMEVGGDLDQEEQAGNPSSPSSSGQRQDNPLLLLGQYSDEEADGNTSKVEKIASEETSSVDTDGKVEENVDHNEDTTDIDKDTVCSNGKLEFDEVDVKANIDVKEVEKASIATGVVSSNEVHSTIKTYDHDASGMQIVGDASGGWKLVMHDESNQYYYWNTLTGETSWEVPDVMAQAAGTSGQDMSSLGPDQHTRSLPYAVNGAVDIRNVDLISRGTPEYMSGSSAGLENSDIVNMVYDPNQTLPNYGSSGIDVSIPQRNESRDKHLTGESHEAIDVHMAQLMTQCESLLEKFKTIERFDWALKCIFEVETRLSDCKALSSFGSSILPFWWHTKAQLDRLDSVLETEILGTIKSEHCNVVDGKDSSPLQGGLELAELGNGTSTASEHIHYCDADVAKEIKKEETQLPTKTFLENENFHSGSPYQISDSGPKAVNLEEDTLPTNFIAKVDSGAGEDVDMDVEMEVDEETFVVQQATGDSSSVGYRLPTEGFVQPESLLEAPLPLEDLSVPPPPDEEWIPPPPSDAEPVPPLPPEEPPSVPPPPYAETAHSFPYVEQYSYSVPSFQYYAPTAGGAQEIGYYTRVDGTHVAETQPGQYYEPVASSSYSNVAAGVPLEPVVYYDPQSGTIPAVPVVTSIDSSTFYVESGSISHTGKVSDHSGSAGFFTQAGSISLPPHNVESDFTSAVSKCEKTNIQANGLSVTSHANESVPMKGNDVDVTPTTAAKNPSKVARSKKRAVAVAPTFRSNKKVSRLVDKWKAAKEELHEDESDDAYEVLEKKRQKEIEEWRARQIASGEAQDNANFLPLGGDWRERVKRRRAESSAESVHTPSEEVGTEKKPDLVELSRGLPSGWQVYWDESSKKVYYGNLNTSETTWTRPSS